MQAEQPAPRSAATVYLVGAGPGDPGLLTQAGAAALARAAAVVHDYLANPALLALCPANCRRVYVGKSGASHSMPQEQIEKLLVDLALEFGAGAHCIVRLKGGDPYVFGRGGEEGQTLAAAGVPFVVVPGITAGIAGPAYAGIPVTHRDFTSTVTFVTGHERADAAAEAAAGRVQYSVLAKLGGTLVFYMGVKHLPTIAAELVRGGLPAETPAAMVRWATTARQQTVLATLGTLPAAAQAAGMGAPAITIIGKVAQLRDTLNWFERRPLFGRTVVVTRSRQQVSTLAAELAALGARVLEAPTIAIEPNPPTPELTDALHNVGRFACVVFTSANGVDATWNALRAMRLDSRALAAPIAAVGPATAAALERIGIVPECLPDSYTSDALAAALRGTPALQSAFTAGRPVLLLRAEIARPALRQALEQAGAAVTDIPLYRTVRPAALPEETLQALTEGQVDCLTFTSGSTAEHFAALLPDNLRAEAQRCAKVSMGPVTTAALVKAALPPAREASVHTVAGMVEAVRQVLAR